MSSRRGWGLWDLLAVVVLAYMLDAAWDARGGLVRLGVVALVIVLASGLMMALARVFRG